MSNDRKSPRNVTHKVILQTRKLHLGTYGALIWARELYATAVLIIWCSSLCHKLQIYSNPFLAKIIAYSEYPFSLMNYCHLTWGTMLLTILHPKPIFSLFLATLQQYTISQQLGRHRTLGSNFEQRVVIGWMPAQHNFKSHIMKVAPPTRLATTAVNLLKWREYRSRRIEFLSNIIQHYRAPRL